MVPILNWLHFRLLNTSSNTTSTTHVALLFTERVFPIACVNRREPEACN